MDKSHGPSVRKRHFSKQLFRRFWVKEPRHSENILAETRYLYRRTRPCSAERWYQQDQQTYHRSKYHAPLAMIDEFQRNVNVRSHSGCVCVCFFVRWCKHVRCAGFRCVFFVFLPSIMCGSADIIFQGCVFVYAWRALLAQLDRMVGMYLSRGTIYNTR